MSADRVLCGMAVQSWVHLGECLGDLGIRRRDLMKTPSETTIITQCLCVSIVQKYNMKQYILFFHKDSNISR